MEKRLELELKKLELEIELLEQENERRKSRIASGELSESSTVLPRPEEMTP